MLGILVILLFSWALLYLFDRKNLLVLGFSPIYTRLFQFVLGFIFTSVLCLSVQLLESSLKSSSWVLNEGFDITLLAEYFYWDFKSVLTEELVFRGAILYLIIKKWNARYGVLFSAVVFGIYHWFSFGILGQIVPMIVIFIGTGLMGYAWASAFYKSSSIAMPVGLHLGWNFTFNTIFSNGPLGEGLFIQTNGEAISDWFSLVSIWLVPLITLLFVVFYLPKKP